MSSTKALQKVSRRRLKKRNRLYTIFLANAFFIAFYFVSCFFFIQKGKMGCGAGGVEVTKTVIWCVYLEKHDFALSKKMRITHHQCKSVHIKWTKKWRRQQQHSRERPHQHMVKMVFCGKNLGIFSCCSYRLCPLKWARDIILK